MTTPEPPSGPAPENPEGSVPPPPPPSDGSTSYPPPPGDSGGFGAGGYPPPPPPGDAGYVPPFSAPDAIAYGWNKFKTDVGSWLILGLIAVAFLAIFIVVTFATSIGAAVAGTTSSPSFITLLVFFVISAVFSVAMSILNAVGVRGALDATQGQKFDIAGAFGRLDIPKVVVLSIILAVVGNIGSAVPTALGSLVSLLGLVFTFFTYFAMVFVVDRGIDPIEALTASFELIKANLGDSLLLALLAVLVCIAGVCACFVGLFVAYPVVTIALAFAYKRFQDQPVA